MKVRDLIQRGKEIYPKSKTMQKQWVRKTRELYSRNCHMLQTGKFRFGRTL